MKKNFTKNSTLKTKIARLILAVALVVAQATTMTLPALAAETTADLSSTSTVTVDGVKYTTMLKQGQVQLTVGDKVLLLSKENVMAAANLDKYGTVWMVSYSGRGAGYNYSLQKNEASVNLHTYVNNAENIVLDSNKLAIEFQTTTGKVSTPTLEEFKKLAGFTTSTNGNSSTGGNNNSNNNTGSNTGSSVSGNLNLVENKKVGDKQYTFVVTNGTAQIIVDNKVRTIADKNISEIAIDANGTVLISTNNNGVKETRWCNPTLQTTTELKTYFLTSNPYCILKDGDGLATGVFANSTVVKVLTIEEQKKVLGIVETTTTATVNWERVVKKGDYTYVVYDKNNKRITSYKFKDNILTWRGVKYKNIKRVGVIQSTKDLVVTTLNGNVSVIDYDTMEITRIFTASESKGKAKSYTYTSKGFTTSYITTKGKKVSVKKY